MREMRPARLLLAAAIVSLSPVLAACSGDDPAPTPTASTPAERTPSPLPSVDDAKGVVKDVKLVDCAMEAGSATAAGTLTNTDKESADFAITIAWMPNNSTDPVAVASTTVADVAAKATAEWSVSAQLPTKADRCVINARRGTIG